MRRLLFLIADTGGGHRAAAVAVERQMAETAPGEFEITILDPFNAAKQKVIGGTAGLYGPITRHARWLWGGLYHATNSRPAVTMLERTVLRSVQTAVTDAIHRLDPDCVVSFHPLLNHISVRAVREQARRIPVITVITDLVDIHAAWACPDVDAVVVPSPGGFERCRRAGIPASRCHDIGLAVDRRFTDLPSDAAGIAALRRNLGLRPESFVVLVCGGADGSGGIVRNARAIAAGTIDLDLVVICGRNERARAALAGLRTGAGRDGASPRIRRRHAAVDAGQRRRRLQGRTRARSLRHCAAGCRCCWSGTCPVRSAATSSGWSTSAPVALFRTSISCSTRSPSSRSRVRRRSPRCASRCGQPRARMRRGASRS